MSGEDIAGLAFVAVGELALVLVGLTGPEILAALGHAAGGAGSASALRRSARLWRSAARSALLLGALAALEGLVTLIASTTGPDVFMPGLGQRVPPVAATLALWATLSLPVVRLLRRAEAAVEDGDVPPAASAAGRWLRVERWLGYGLLLAILVRPVVLLPQSARLRSLEMLLHWPAWLVVAGGALAVLLYLGRPLAASLSLGLACAGLLGGLFGLAQAFHGFAGQSFAALVGGMAQAISSCFAALCGLALFAVPLEDPGEDPPPVLARACSFAWSGLPLFSLAVVVLAIVLSLIPMRMR